MAEEWGEHIDVHAEDKKGKKAQDLAEPFGTDWTTMSVGQPVNISIALNQPPHVLLLVQLLAWREETSK